MSPRSSGSIAIRSSALPAVTIVSPVFSMTSTSSTDRLRGNLSRRYPTSIFMPVDSAMYRDAMSTASLCTGGIYNIMAISRGSPMAMPITHAVILIILCDDTLVTLHYGMKVEGF